TTNDDAGLGIGADASGNVSVCGFFDAPTLDLGGGHSVTGGGTDNGFIASFEAGGTHRWSLGFGGVGYSDCQQLRVDPSGNVVTAGEFSGTTDFGGGKVTSAGDFDAFIASYTSIGAHRFSHRLGGAQMDDARGVAFDAAGNVALAGMFHGTVDFGN